MLTICLCKCDCVKHLFDGKGGYTTRLSLGSFAISLYMLLLGDITKNVFSLLYKTTHTFLHSFSPTVTIAKSCWAVFPIIIVSDIQFCAHCVLQNQDYNVCDQFWVNTSLKTFHQHFSPVLNSYLTLLRNLAGPEKPFWMWMWFFSFFYASVCVYRHHGPLWDLSLFIWTLHSCIICWESTTQAVHALHAGPRLQRTQRRPSIHVSSNMNTHIIL